MKNSAKCFGVVILAFMSAATMAEDHPFYIHDDIPLYASLPAVQGITVLSSVESRAMAGSAIAVAFRNVPYQPAGTLSVADTFRVRYIDGSGEEFVVANVSAEDGSVPIPGTQLSAGSIPSSPMIGMTCDPGMCTTGSPTTIHTSWETITCSTWYDSSGLVSSQDCQVY